MSLLEKERRLWKQGLTRIAGVDEAGRGCLAGPVVAAAVVLPPHTRIEGVADSKSLGKKRREALLAEIKLRALGVGVGRCSPEEIDELNILHAAMRAMRRAVEALPVDPDHVLIDGNRCFPNSPWPYDTIVKGDTKCHAIAAASIVAKVTRDRLMCRLHEEHPAFSWNTNVGYPTKAHYDALAEHGPTLYHRRSFRLERAS